MVPQYVTDDYQLITHYCRSKMTSIVQRRYTCEVPRTRTSPSDQPVFPVDVASLLDHVHLRNNLPIHRRNLELTLVELMKTLNLFTEVRGAYTCSDCCFQSALYIDISYYIVQIKRKLNIRSL